MSSCPKASSLKERVTAAFPVGPLLAVPDPDEFHLLDELELRLEVNGQLRQHDTTANLLFRPAESLTELSTFCDLSPGARERISLTAPVRNGRPPQNYMAVPNTGDTQVAPGKSGTA
jgi:hypothetical protein